MDMAMVQELLRQLHEDIERLRIEVYLLRSELASLRVIQPVRPPVAACTSTLSTAFARLCLTLKRSSRALALACCWFL